MFYDPLFEILDALVDCILKAFQIMKKYVHALEASHHTGSLQ